ncbi:glucosidase 2 subunit beta-like [Bombyx mori]|uniref:Glucosidase 2 subunit beta n=1 Tax=Bombyx mori TaxID=7091 RepID=L8B6C5_BOMMO|nr:glucosidase 2 subunit beta-like [Bombyx mori]BAM78679.1 glucosidase II beta-subunit [Bombyx mori]
MVCKTWIDRFSSYFVIFCSVIIFAQSDVPRPRGVSLSKASLYLPTKDFTCFDGTATIPFSYVNDDYCDCFDGSDEPGTSACINGVFHCTNAGHRPQNLPSSRVNDGVCDCCDGTDEYANPTACTNICEELGKEARAEAQRVAELHKAGSQLRIDLIEKGNKKRNEMAEQLTQLEKDKSEAEKIKAEKELLKNDLEMKENEVLKVYREAEELEKQKKLDQEKETNLKESTEHFNRFDSNNDGELSIDEIKVVNVFDRNKDGQVDDDEVKMFLGGDEKVDKDAFLSTTWPILKPLLMMEQGMFKPEDAKTDTTETEAEENHEELDADFEGNEEDNSDLDLQEEHEEDETVSEQSKSYNDETQKIVDQASEARRQYTDAERTVREIESNIRNIKQNLEKDYGLEQEFASLDGDCFEYEDKEYVYKLCMFQKVTQKSKNGGMEVGLGNWGEWAGPENNKYSVMKYTNGIACWNGPSRTTTVNVNCDLETKITSVTEPFRCEYKMELSTPAACDDSSTSQEHTSHDEL